MDDTFGRHTFLFDRPAADPESAWQRWACFIEPSETEYNPARESLFLVRRWAKFLKANPLERVNFQRD